jgi:hypothetical protein
MKYYFFASSKFDSYLNTYAARFTRDKLAFWHIGNVAGLDYDLSEELVCLFFLIKIEKKKAIL